MLFREIDLLKEENSQLTKAIDEQSVKLVALEEELKKTRDSKTEVQDLFCLNSVLSIVIAISDTRTHTPL